MKILLLAIPLLLPLLSIFSIAIPIYLFAKVKGNTNLMSSGRKKFFIFSALLPFILMGLMFVFLKVASDDAINRLANDIKTGALTVYKIDESDTTHTQKVAFKDNSGTQYLSFDIFANNLYAEQKDGDINIQTKEFQGNSQIKQNSIGFVRFLKHGDILPDADGQEAYLKKERTPYTRTETDLGTVFESQEKDSYPNSGRFLYELFFKNSDYSMLISVSYNSEEDLRVRYSPVVSREYAQKLYNLIKSTVKVDPTKLGSIDQGSQEATVIPSTAIKTNQTAASATIDSNLTANSVTGATLSGSAQGISKVMVILADPHGEGFWSQEVAVVNGKWKVTVPDLSFDFPAGKYQITVNDPLTNPHNAGPSNLALGTLNVIK